VTCVIVIIGVHVAEEAAHKAAEKAESELKRRYAKRVAAQVTASIIKQGSKVVFPILRVNNGITALECTVDCSL